MDNTLTQWISEDTRFSNEGETSRLDPVFSKEPEGIEDVNIGCPVAKSDHATLEFNVIEEVENKRKEEHCTERLNYSKTDLENMRNFFSRREMEQILRPRMYMKNGKNSLKFTRRPKRSLCLKGGRG